MFRKFEKKHYPLAVVEFWKVQTVNIFLHRSKHRFKKFQSNNVLQLTLHCRFIIRFNWHIFPSCLQTIESMAPCLREFVPREQTQNLRTLITPWKLHYQWTLVMETCFWTLLSIVNEVSMSPHPAAPRIFLIPYSAVKLAHRRRRPRNIPLRPRGLYPCQPQPRHKVITRSMNDRV